MSSFQTSESMHTTPKSNQTKKKKKSYISSVISTHEPVQTGEVSFFPAGIYIAAGLVVDELHKKALNKLLEGQTKTVRLEKIHHKENVYSIRASKGARIMGVCAPCSHHNNQAGFFVFAFFDKHQYEDLKFMDLTDLKHPVVDLSCQTKETAIIQQALDQIPAMGKNKNQWREVDYINNQAICFSDLIWVRMSGTKLRKNKSYSSIIYS